MRVRLLLRPDYLRWGNMRTKLRLAAASVAFVSLVFWFFGGPNWGWTKTTVEKWQVDPVTQIEYPVIEKRFNPGLDLLAASLAGAVALFGISLLARRD